MKRPTAAILAVGTEITDGQIVNRNSAWISTRLTDLGFIMSEHRSVPDERELMKQTLRDLGSRYDYIFITGGLGPTTDDFTRDVVAEVFDLPMVFDEVSWKRVNERLRSRGVPVSPSQKQQCFFPEGSQILLNSSGTANGFYFQSKTKVHVYVLPGPPHEVAAIWQDEIASKLESLIPENEKDRLFLFRCMGKGESQFADMTEAIFAEVEGVRLGYRAHAPYVEIKIWARPSVVASLAPKLQELETALGNCLINRDHADLMTEFLNWVGAGNRVRVIDLASAGYFTERLLLESREIKRETPLGLTLATEYRFPRLKSGETSSFMRAAGANESVLVMAIDETTTGFLVGISSSGREAEHRLLLPMQIKPDSDRGRKFLVEKALQAFRDTAILS